MTLRTRFAPSPTGYLHVGGARTALFCWLYARRNGGIFLLRIEDTDRERSTEQSIDAILEGMRWLRLDYDEGPFYQTQRFDRYREAASDLLQRGKAYRCYCSKERLDALRDEQMALKQKPRYDGFCREREGSSVGPSVVRFKNPLQGEVVVDDAVRGRVVFQNSELDDLIIVRSDDTPTYNFTVVVDDMDMRVTHVIRGDDHLNNTPRQMNILTALGAAPPTYAHVPMILGEDGKRLSKRHGAVSVMQYRDDGFLPEALINYLVRLGWAHGDQEIFSLTELINAFDIGGINRSAASFNSAKLLWMNQHYLKTCAVDYVAEHLRWHMQNLNIDTTAGPDLTQIVMAQRERVKTLVEMAEASRYFYNEDITYDANAVSVHLRTDVYLPLTELQERLEQLAYWKRDAIHQALLGVCEQHGLKLNKLAQPLRVALTGSTVSPPIDLTAELIGRDKSLRRLTAARLRIEEMQTATRLRADQTLT